MSRKFIGTATINIFAHGGGRKLDSFNFKYIKYHIEDSENFSNFYIVLICGACISPRQRPIELFIIEIV